MKPHKKVEAVLEEMEQIGGVPTPEEFYNEFDFRLRAKLFGGTSTSERELEKLTAGAFNERFDNLELYEEGYTEVIEMLAAVIHNPKVQSQVTDMYLEHKGYDLEALEERGKKFLGKMIEKAKANDNGRD